MAHTHHHRHVPAYDEIGATDFDPVIDAAQHGEMAEVAANVSDGDVYRAEALDLRNHELAVLRPLLKARGLGLFADGNWWLISAVRECPTCLGEVLKGEQCDLCVGPGPVAA